MVSCHNGKKVMSTNNERKPKTEYRENKLPARLLHVGEVASFLGVHSSTVRRWVKKGLLKSYVIGLRHNLRFKQEDVLGFLNKCTGQSMSGVALNGGSDRERHKIKLEVG
jgi:excisionase family DNA binding protein